MVRGQYLKFCKNENFHKLFLGFNPGMQFLGQSLSQTLFYILLPSLPPPLLPSSISFLEKQKDRFLKFVYELHVKK